MDKEKRFVPTWTFTYRLRGEDGKHSTQTGNLSDALLDFHARQQLYLGAQPEEYQILEVRANFHPEQRWLGDELPKSPPISKCTLSRRLAKLYEGELKKLGMEVAVA
jgi:hypothetical protein